MVRRSILEDRDSASKRVGLRVRSKVSAKLLAGFAIYYTARVKGPDVAVAEAQRLAPTHGLYKSGCSARPPGLLPSTLGHGDGNRNFAFGEILGSHVLGFEKQFIPHAGIVIHPEQEINIGKLMLP